MLTILGMVKTGAAFTLFLKDSEKAALKKGYLWNTETGDDEALRAALQHGGASTDTIESLFVSAEAGNK